MVLPLRLATNPTWLLFLSLTPPTSVPDCMAQMAGCLPCNPERLQGPFSALGHWKLAAFCVIRHMGQSSIPRFGICCFQNPKMLTRCFASIIMAGVLRFNNLSFTLKELSKHCAPKTFMDLASPWVLPGFISHPLGPMCYAKTSADSSGRS